MRVLQAVVAGFLLAAPAAAQESVEQQLGAAERTFLQDLGPGDMADGRYYAALTAGLSGTWVARRMLGATAVTDVGGSVARACAIAPAAITMETPLSLTIAEGAGERAMRVTYAYVGGVSFAPLFDLDAFLKRQGTFSSRADLSAIAGALERVAIYRPSADVLVIARALAEPQIYLRCGPGAPAPAPVPPGQPAGTLDGGIEPALAAALGRSFDGQFQGGADPAVRDAFIACAAAVMQGLSEADLKLLIETNFMPANDELARIRDTYPDVGEGARTCAEAAQRAIAAGTAAN